MSTTSNCPSSSLQPITLAPIKPDDGIESEPYIFASLRYDKILLQSPENTKASFNRPCPFYLLEHQWTRLQVANWSTSFYRKGTETSDPAYGGPSKFLYGLLSAVKNWYESHPNEKPESLRIKIRSYVSGRVTTELSPYTRSPLSDLFISSFDLPPDAQTEWKVVLDNQSTEITESTMYKTSDREPYTRARANARIKNLLEKKEVLLYNPDRTVLDGSTSTPFFHRNGRWVTPSSSCGVLQGTTRRWALENGLCVEGEVAIDSLSEGEVVWFSNAVKGFFWATYISGESAVKDGDDALDFEVPKDRSNGSADTRFTGYER